ncbi:hypothetical protein CMUS01_00212 [Colletotrichum musicola]|uniref:Uncharacterized protein n=1 Tax=Colletotrichum musicola TaxID=2175873 RepID=A0A8H6NZ27_9PEZI|nr:hypothetical protein CMUS01_00212 [Colletotrichum musicola]
MGRATPGLYNDANRQRSHFGSYSASGSVYRFHDTFPDDRFRVYNRDEIDCEGRADTFYSAPESRSCTQLLDESHTNREVRAQNPTGYDGASQLRPSGGFVDGISRFEKEVVARDGEERRRRAPRYEPEAFEQSLKYNKPPYEEGGQWQSDSMPMAVTTPQKLDGETWLYSELADPGVGRPGLASILDSPWESEQRKVHASKPWERQPLLQV